MSIRVVLCDDHTIVLEGLEQLLGTEADLEVVETCTDGPEAIRAVEEHRPSVLVIDYRLAGETGLDALKTLAARGIDVPAVILSASIDDEALLGIARQEVKGVVLKESASSRLVSCIRRVTAGQVDVPEALMRRASELLEAGEGANGGLATLTDREREIADEAARGRSNKRIARDFGISESTVKAHMHSIFRKVGVMNRVQLTLLISKSRRGRMPRTVEPDDSTV